MSWASRTTKSIPSIHSHSQTFEINDYSKGMNDFVSNDKFPLRDGESNMWRLAQDARIDTLGEYTNRKGFDFHSDAAGETQDQAVTSVTGATALGFSTATRLAQKFTAGSTGRLTRLDLLLANTNSATGTITVELWTNSSGAPGVLIARSSIAANLLSGSAAYLTARFPDAPSVTATTVYWIVVYVQATGTNTYAWSCTTSATTAIVSTDSGGTWTPLSYAMNFKQYYATAGGTKGVLRAYKSDGTAITLFAHDTVLYSVNEVTGALTSIKTGLNASATHYRFTIVNDIVYYINGYDGLRKWDFTTESQVSATNYSLIAEHKGLLFLVPTLDGSKAVFSNFADYEVFTSTDFIYVPSPKTGDPITAILSLNGYLFFWTRDNKYILSGDDNATFILGEAPDQKGTFSQETVTSDKNFAYYLSDDGVYRSNGSEAQLLSENIYQSILELQNKDESVLVVNKGRLYMWYQESGASANDRCWVWNLNFASSSDTIESNDTEAFVNRAVSAYRDEDTLLVGSSIVGQVYWQEAEANDDTNLGGDINFTLQTHYMTFESPAVLKEIRYWIPRLAAQSGNYTMKCDYAYDLRNNWTTQNYVNVQASGYIWGSASSVWASFTWGSTSEIQTSTYVPGEYRRIALRYYHHATRQPQRFLGHTIRCESRRIR